MKKKNETVVVEPDDDLEEEREHFEKLERIVEETNRRNENAILAAEIDRGQDAIENKKACIRGMLERMLSPKFLDDLAEAVSESSLKLKDVTPKVLARIILNTQLYVNYGSLLDVVEGTELRGLRSRDFRQVRVRGARLPKQSESTARSRQSKAARVASRQKGVTADFAHALLLVNPSLINIDFLPFKSTINKAVNVWTAQVYKLHLEYVANGRRDAMGYMRRLLNDKCAEVSDGVALVPLSKYMSAALAANLGPEECVARARQLGKAIMANLHLLPLVGKTCITDPYDLPAGRQFIARYIVGNDEPNQDGYWKRHAREVFDRLFDCYAFSLVGRNTFHGTGPLRDLSSAVEGIGSMADKIRDHTVNNEFTAVSDGFETRIFAVIESDAARSLLEEALPYCTDRKTYVDVAKTRLHRMCQEALIHMISLSERTESANVHHYAMKFGKIGLWQ